MDKIYGEIIRSKDPTSTSAWYRLYYADPKESQLSHRFRDQVDAENAAEDEAKARGLKIIWRR